MYIDVLIVVVVVIALENKKGCNIFLIYLLHKKKNIKDTLPCFTTPQINSVQTSHQVGRAKVHLINT